MKSNDNYIDRAGINLGILRHPNETDKAYRDRIIRELQSNSPGGSLMSIRAAVEDVLPVSVGVSLGDRIGHVMIVLHESLWRRLLIVPAWLHRRCVRGAVSDQLAAGVILSVKTQKKT